MRHLTEEQLHGQGKFQEYLGEFVYGGIDGSVTTFAVVAGAAGAGLDSSVVIILGFANLIADGFSMSVGSYLSTKSEQQNYEKHKAVEYWEVEQMPDKEREEVREIFQAKGFEGDLLEKVVDTITADKDRWVDTMMKEELEMSRENRSPLAMGGVTFLSFIVVGFIPLVIYVYDLWSEKNGLPLFLISCVLTALTFILIGFLKGQVTRTHRWKNILETLFLGVSAAVLAYAAGNFLEKLFF